MILRLVMSADLNSRTSDFYRNKMNVKWAKMTQFNLPCTQNEIRFFIETALQFRMRAERTKDWKLQL
jgi:hypothetical protein